MQVRNRLEDMLPPERPACLKRVDNVDAKHCRQDRLRALEREVGMCSAELSPPLDNDKTRNRPTLLLMLILEALSAKTAKEVLDCRLDSLAATRY